MIIKDNHYVCTNSHLADAVLAAGGRAVFAEEASNGIDLSKRLVIAALGFDIEISECIFLCDPDQQQYAVNAAQVYSAKFQVGIDGSPSNTRELSTSGKADQSVALSRLGIDCSKPVDPPRFAAMLAGTQLGKLAMSHAKARKFPANTSAIMALSLASTPVSMCYAVCYPDGTAVPTGLYVIAEQPPGTGKTSVVTRFSKPAELAVSKMNKRAEEKEIELKERNKDEAEIPKKFKMNITNGTTESLDAVMTLNNGHFSITSSEKGAINTMLGISYGDGKEANSDVLLKGFNAEWHSSTRVTRAGFDGFPYGSISLLSQDGIVDTLISASNGNGLAERFLMIDEPDMLGKRVHGIDDDKSVDHVTLEKYQKACNRIVSIFEQDRPDSFDDLKKLSISRKGWIKIYDVMNDIEPQIAEGGKYSSSLLRGSASKVDQKIMKIASVLYVIETLMSDGYVKSEIDEKYIDIAIDIAKLSIEYIHDIMVNKGIIGYSAEKNAIEKVFIRANGRPLKWRELHNSLKNIKPFKDVKSDRAGAIKKALYKMVIDGDVISSVRRQGATETELFILA